VITQGGIHDEEALHIYTDGSSFPGKRRAAGVSVVLMWVNEAGNPRPVSMRRRVTRSTRSIAPAMRVVPGAAE
jgi:hypothetical protein